MSKEKRNLIKEERVYPTDALRVKLGPAVCKYRTNTDEIFRTCDRVLSKEDKLIYTTSRFIKYDVTTCRYRECKPIDTSMLLKVTVEIPLYKEHTKECPIQYYSVKELLEILDDTLEPNNVTLGLVFDVISYNTNKYDKSFRIANLEYQKDGSNFDKIVIDSFDFAKKSIKRYINNNLKKEEPVWKN